MLTVFFGGYHAVRNVHRNSVWHRHSTRLAAPFNVFGGAKLPASLNSPSCSITFLPKHLEIGEKFRIFAVPISSVSENQDFGAGISDG